MPDPLPLCQTLPPPVLDLPPLVPEPPTLCQTPSPCAIPPPPMPDTPPPVPDPPPPTPDPLPPYQAPHFPVPDPLPQSPHDNMARDHRVPTAGTSCGVRLCRHGNDFSCLPVLGAFLVCTSARSLCA